MNTGPVTLRALAGSAAVGLPSGEAIDALSLADLIDLRAHLTGVLGRVEARLILIAVNGSDERKATGCDGGRPLLDVRDVAARLRVSCDYVYRHARDWPFTRRVGRALRFEADGLARWQARHASRG